MQRASAVIVLALLTAACAGDPGSISAPDASAARAGKAGGVNYTLTPLDYPGSTLTSLSGINAAGHVVGWYRDQAGRQHGFVHGNGTFTTIDYPGASVTWVRGIGPGGDMVGAYRMPHELPLGINQHGFLRTSAGEFSEAAYPGHTGSIPQRILPDGTILGCFHDDDLMDTMLGAVLGGAPYTHTDAYASMHNGATPDGRTIVGLYRDMMTGRSRAYVIHDGVFTPFDVPGSIATWAWDIDPSGETIVGIYRTSASDGTVTTHGYVLRDGEFTTIDYPGSTYTDVLGINARGDIVGSFVMNGRTHGFVGRRGPRS